MEGRGAVRVRRNLSRLLRAAAEHRSAAMPGKGGQPGPEDFSMRSAADSTSVRNSGRAPESSPRAGLLRSSEWAILLYFTYAAAVGLALPLRPPVGMVACVVNLNVVTGTILLAHMQRLRPTRFWSVLRDWYPLPLMLLGYRQMGWFALPKDNIELELSWVAWDRWLLNQARLKPAIESLGPLLPGLLEICYSLVYALPAFSMAMLCVYGKRERMNALLNVLLPGFFLCYALFPFFPSEPPRTVFPGQDFPGFQTPFRRFNWALLGGYGIHTSVFPSAHVAGAFSAAFGMMRALPEKKWVGRFLLVMAILISTSTIYGRYHYAVDAVAGLGLAAVAAGLARRLGAPAVLLLAAALVCSAQDTRWKALTRSERGYGPVAAHQVDSSGEYRLNRFTAPARPGDTLVLWGTGLGSAEPRRDVTVYIGGLEVAPLYAGPAPGLPDSDQVNVRLPEGVQTGCFVPLVVKAGAAASDVYTVSIGAGRVCQPELRFFDRKTEAMDEGGVARVYALAVWTEADGALKRGTAEAWIADYDLADAAVLTLETLETPAAPSCSRIGRAAPPGFHGARRGPPVGLSVTGPGGCQLRWTPGGDGVWRAPVGPGCVPTDATMSYGNWRTWTRLDTTMPWPALPVVTAQREPAPVVAWQDGPGDRFGWEARSGFRLHGNIFGGAVYSERSLHCRLRGSQGSVEVPDLDWALGLPEPSMWLVRRQGFVGAGRSESSSIADFNLVHVRHELVTPLESSFLPPVFGASAGQAPPFQERLPQ